jgi:hypothetical protein
MAEWIFERKKKKREDEVQVSIVPAVGVSISSNSFLPLSNSALSWILLLVNFKKSFDFLVKNMSNSVSSVNDEYYSASESSHDESTIAQNDDDVVFIHGDNKKRSNVVAMHPENKPKSLGMFDFAGFHYVSKGVKWTKRGWVDYFNCKHKSFCNASVNIRLSDPDFIYVTNPLHKCTQRGFEMQRAPVVDICENMKDRTEELAISNLSDRAVTIWKSLKNEFLLGMNEYYFLFIFIATNKHDTQTRQEPYAA